MESKKGQYFSFDAVMATLVFLLAISMLSSYWFGVRAAAEKGDDTHREALRISDALLLPGTPPGWPSAREVYSYGLGKENATAEIEKAKVERFESYVSLDYNRVREVLRTSDEFFLTIEPVMGNSFSYSIGREPEGATTAAKVTRISTMEVGGVLEPVRLTLVLWNSRR